MNDQQIKTFENGKRFALIAGGIVYAGVVLLFLSFYQTLMASQFTGFLKVLASIGAVLVALNALALPFALHYWTVTALHKGVAITFYVLDVLTMTLNVLASAGMNSDITPGWVSAYSAYAPASIVLTLAGWAVLFMTDPGQRALVRLNETLTEAQVSIVKRATEYLQSDEGVEKIIVPVASRLAARVFNERKLIGTAQALPADTVTPPSPLDMQEIIKQLVTVTQAQQKPAPQPEEVGPTVTPFGSNGRQKH